MRKEERKEKRPEKNVRPSPPSHYQPINYSSLHQSSREPTLSTLSLCTAARPLVPDSTSTAGPPSCRSHPQMEHQRRRSRKGRRQVGRDGAEHRRRGFQVLAACTLSLGGQISPAPVTSRMRKAEVVLLLVLVTFLLLLSSPSRSFPLLFLSSCWASATPWPP